MTRIATHTHAVAHVLIFSCVLDQKSTPPMPLDCARCPHGDQGKTLS